MSTTIEYRNPTARTWQTVEIVFRPHSVISDRWNVLRADNSRLLGWINRPSGYGEHGKEWDARVHAGAFRGSNIDDLGDALDHVPGYLFNSLDSIGCQTLGYDRTRLEAAYTLVAFLSREQAPALGYGAHYAVRTYDRAF